MASPQKWLVGLIVLGCVLSSSVPVQVLAVPPEPGVTPRPTVVQTKDGLTLDWRVSMSQIHITPRADGTLDVTLPGASQTHQPSLPQLPFDSALIAVPPDATPTLHVLAAEEQTIPLPARREVALAPMPSGVQRDASGYVIGGAFSPISTAIPSTMDQVVTLEPVGVVRGVRLARVAFYPVRPVKGQPYARVTTHLRVSITFGGQVGNVFHATRLDPLLAAVQSTVVNPDQVQPRSPIPTRSIQSPIRNPTGAGSALTAIEVSAPGLTAISYEALNAIGFPVDSTDPHFLHLMHAGNEVAIEWDGNGDTHFEPGERLLFYADPRSSRWTYGDVYFLWRDATPGLRMSSRSAAPTGQPGIAWATATAEVNALYTPDGFYGPIPAGRDGDRWTWDALRLPDRALASYPVELPFAVDVTQPSMLTVWLIGYTDVTASPDHRVDVSLNDVYVGRVEWNGKRAITATLPITPGILRGGINTLTLTLPGLAGVNVEGMWLDAFSINCARSQASAGASVRFDTTPTVYQEPAPLLPRRLYLPLVTRNYAQQQAPAFTVALVSPGPYRAYDVTDPLHPQRLTDMKVNGNSVTLSDPPEGGAHRYIVTSAEGILNPARVRPAESLSGFHATGGFTGADYAIITHPAFADALGPLASLRQSQGLTTTVINVLGIYDEWGDGRPDPEAIRAFIANAYATWQPRPTFILLVGDGSFDPKRYRTDSPPTFIPPFLADVDPWAGETAADNRYVTVDGADDLPDLLIGRLPVKTLAEAQAVVDKIVRYETAPFPGGWNRNMAFVADDTDPKAGDFAAQSEIIATAYVTSPFTPQRIYFTPPATTVTATRQATLNAWNTGALLVQFAGHSSWQQWAQERFFHLDDLPTLHNGRRWPIVVEMTCFTGAFHRPEPTLDEALLTLNSGGAVAAWGATGLGVGTGHAALDDGFFRAALRDSVSTLGQATLAGKLSLAATGQNLDLLNTFVLLGDPALRFNRTIIPWASQIYLPLISK